MKFYYKFILLIIFLILSVLAVSLSTSMAAEIDIGDGGTFDDVQTAVDSVSDGDTIWLNNHSFRSNGYSINVNKNNLIIDGGIKGDNSVNNRATFDGMSSSRVFKINGSGVVLKNLVISNGVHFSYNDLSSTGGGVEWTGSNGIVDNCVFYDNYVYGDNEAHGGGIAFVETNNIEVKNSVFLRNTIESNHSSAGGANLFSTSNNTHIFNCSFINGKSTSVDYVAAGAGVQIAGENITGLVENCTFLSNLCFSVDNLDLSHGGAFCANSPLVILRTCIFSRNSAYQGGAITLHTNCTIDNCSFINNSADDCGGAISTGWDDVINNSVNITNSYFEANNAPTGGALQLKGEKIQIVNCTFDRNNGNYGGALYDEASVLGLIIDSKFKNNLAYNGSAIYNNGKLNISNSSYFDNQAQSYIITAINKIVRQGEILTILSYYECGDNLIDAIYNSGLIVLNGNIPQQSCGCVNQTVLFLFNNLTYFTNTNSSGFAVFNILINDLDLKDYIYFIGHEESSLYSAISNSSTIKVLKGTILDSISNTGVYGLNNINTNYDLINLYNVNNRISSRYYNSNYLSPVSSSNFLKNIRSGVIKTSFVPYLANKKDNYPYCGASVLQQLLASKGIYVDKQILIAKLNPKNGQISMYDILGVAKEYGVKLYASKILVSSLKSGDIALITINGKNHYVTIFSVDDNYVVYKDPDLGYVKVLRSEFEKQYGGYVLSDKNSGIALSDIEQKSLNGGEVGMVILLVTSLALFSAVGRLFVGETAKQLNEAITGERVPDSENGTFKVENLTKNGGKPQGYPIDRRMTDNRTFAPRVAPLPSSWLKKSNKNIYGSKKIVKSTKKFISIKRFNEGVIKSIRRITKLKIVKRVKSLVGKTIVRLSKLKIVKRVKSLVGKTIVKLSKSKIVRKVVKVFNTIGGWFKH